MAKVSILASIISNSFGIFLAVKGFGVWSLVYKTILQSVISAIYFWKISDSVPSLKFNKDAFRDLFKFGGNLMALGLIDSIYSNVNYLIIGKYYSVATLGQYTRAEVFKQLPSQTLTQVVQKVSFPLLSEMQNDKQKLQFAYRRLIKTTMLISMIGLFLLSSISKELIIVLMGAQWEQAGEFLQILCFSAIFFPLDALNGNILKVFNRSDIILKIGVLRKVIAIPLFILLIKRVYHYYFLYGLIFHQFVSFLLISNYSIKYINYGTWDQIKDITHFLVLTILTYLVLTVLDLFF
ncbi:MAG: oligosaccharide flippase family protein [Bacteroidetes bacterium]|nr:oligosaccharide flippase family protein [Bacteroidota bacterium]